MNNELTMDKVKECLHLLAYAADEVFQTLDKVEKLIGERSENGKN